MRATQLLVLFLATTCVITQAQQQYCRALVLEAGGELGAYEAGVLQGLVNGLPEGESNWDVVTGVSAGSLNTVYIGTFAVGDEKEMADSLVNLWKNIKKSDVYKSWPLGITQGLLWKTGMFNSDPLRGFITKVLKNRPQQRKISMGSANARTGEFMRFNETYPDLVSGALASAAIPGFFPYITTNGEQYLDGGTIRLVDIQGAIRRCMEIVSDPSQIILDAIYVNSRHQKFLDKGEFALKAGFAAYNQLKYHDTYRELTEAYEFYPTVNYRYIIAPSQRLKAYTFPMTFKPWNIQSNIDLGIQDAQAALQNGPNGNAYEALVEAYDALFKLHDVDPNKV